MKYICIAAPPGSTSFDVTCTVMRCRIPQLLPKAWNVTDTMRPWGRQAQYLVNKKNTEKEDEIIPDRIKIYSDNRKEFITE